jgi:uncharacterized protein with von Willebrand factor type A (vWA) domain
MTMTCSRCEKTKDSFYFTQTNLAACGTRGLCKACRSILNKSYAAKMKKMAAAGESPLISLTCSCCKTLKKMHEMTISTVNKDKTKGVCKQCASTRNKAAREKSKREWEQSERKRIDAIESRRSSLEPDQNVL